MNQFFDNKPETQTDESEKTSYGQKVFDMVNAIKRRVRDEEKKLRKMGPQQGRRGSRIRWRRNNDLSP